MSQFEQPKWPASRMIFWVFLTLVTIVIFGSKFIDSFRPDPNMVVDFAQEWLSAKNYQVGLPVYSDHQETLRQHLDLTIPNAELIIRYNAHPPVAVLLALPLAYWDYPTAMFVWNVTTFGLFLVAIALIVRELELPFVVWSLLPVTALLVGSFPMFFQLAEGQLNCLLAFLLVLAWVADRRGWQLGSGLAIGTAAAIKLFPLFLLVYFAATRRWRAVMGVVVAFVILNAAAVGMFGIETYRFYVTEVVPRVADRFQTSPRNSAIAGFWLRLFAPHPDVGMQAITPQPVIGMLIANMLRAVVVGITAWLAWRASSVAARDRVWAVATVGMLLVAPLTWSHYFLLLVMPCCWVWQRTRGLVLRVVMWVVFLLLVLPDNLGVMVFRGLEEAKRFGTAESRVLSGVEGLYMVALQHYALVGLFVLTILTPTPTASFNDQQPGTEPRNPV